MTGRMVSGSGRMARWGHRFAPPGVAGEVPGQQAAPACSPGDLDSERGGPGLAAEQRCRGSR